jgi:hypothetical protein
MNIVTLDQIIAWRPCRDYTDNDNALLLRLAGGATEWPLIDIMRRSDIPAADRVWIATQKNVLTDAQRTAWLDVVVTRAVRNHALGTLIDAWARRWLSGEDRSEASAETARALAAAAWASAEAEAAASDAEAAAAWAAKAAMWASAARAAKAADAAMWAAAAAEAWAAERQQQVADLIAVLENKRTSTPDAPETLL